MRLQLIELLTFPRLFVADSIEQDDCPHRSRFHASDPRCGDCDHGPECEWLESAEPFVDLANRPSDVLAETLRVAVAYVDQNNHRSRHRIATCVCGSCRWLQKAQQLLRVIDGRAVVSTPLT